MVDKFGGPGDLYAVLGLSMGADTESIIRAYRRLALQHHPDKSKDGLAATAAFQNIQEAYEVLRDPARRRLYDESRAPTQEEKLDADADAGAEAPEQKPGGLVVGTCLLGATVVCMCGAWAGLGAMLCGVGGRLLEATENQKLQRRLAAAACMTLGLLCFGGSETLWMIGLYLATAAGIGVLFANRDQLPDFLPYLLFGGYLLLYLLAPVRPSTARVLLEVPGFVVMEDDDLAETGSDSTLPECAAIFTWGILAMRWLLAGVASRSKNRKETEVPMSV
mmetsp:Transcript_87451/g.245482  ORF Transcript_87451/g.245482 Transcript_87451/m.245482 type:complete len:278 (+) Transcript_87451:110-943(+)